MAKFEAHITFHINDAEKVKSLGEIHNWKFSQIEGDALMGPKPYCYLTGYEPDEHVLHTRMMDTVSDANLLGICELRTKIERIIWDSKTQINEIGVAS